MLLNAEELLALVNGDAEPDRLADLLDRLENCPDSAAALHVLVALRANREDGMEALQEAANADSIRPILHPSARPYAKPSTGWGMQALRLAASFAVVGILGIVAATSFWGTESGASTVAALATADYMDTHLRETAAPVEQTSNAVTDIENVARLLDAGHYAEAREALNEMPYDSEGRVPMYRGMLEYFSDNYEEALARFAEVTSRDTGVGNQAAWYEANTFLALDRPMDALIALERLASGPDYVYRTPAAETYDALCNTLGINSSRVSH